MREIKFRCLSDWKWEYATLDELCKNLWFDYGTPSNVIAFADWEHKTQYTWLKDKNWKDVYEWDVFDMWIIQFSEGRFNGCYIAHTTSEKWWDYSDEWEDGMADYVSKNEIKGNIYEHPHLLTK